MNIYETKKEVKSKNNYTPTHTLGGGGGLFDLPCTKGQLLMDAKLFNGTTKYQKFFLSPKITYLDYIKFAWSPLQPIWHCSWFICKQAQDRHFH